MSWLPTWLSLNSSAMSPLIQVILAAVVAGTLLQSREKSRPTWLLIGFFTAGATFFFSYFMSNATLLRGWVSLIYPFALLSLAALLQFSYHFPQALPEQAAEARAGLAFSAAACLLGLSPLIIELQSHTGVQSYTTARAISGSLILVEFLWVLIILLRRTLCFSQLAAPGRASTTQRPLSFAARVRREGAKLLQPVGESARATRAFALMLAALPIAAIWDLLYKTGVSAGWISETLHTIVFDLFILGFLFAFVALVYLNYTPEINPLITKLILSSLIIVLAVGSILSQVALNSYERDYLQAKLPVVRRVHELLSVTEPGSRLDPAALPEEVAFVMSHPVHSATDKPTYTLDFARDASFDIAFINDHGWGGAGYIGQFGPDSSSRYYAPDTYYYEWDGQRYIVGFDGKSYQDALNARAMPVVAVLLGSTLFILFVFSRFFQFSLIRPLDRLLAGVHQVNAGQLDVKVPIQYNDEVGFLTQSFNKMVVSIQAGERLRAEKETLQHEVRLARTMQLSLLPRSIPAIAGIEIAALSLPAQEVGGDFYNYYALPATGGDPGKSWAIAVGDVSGKGIPAALYMAVSTTMLGAKAPFVPNVAQLMREMNAALYPYMSPNRMNTALCYLRLDPVSYCCGGPGTPAYTAHVANAGMVAPILRRAAQCKYLDVGGLPLGAELSDSPYPALELALQTNDMMVLSSDGIIEAKNPGGELYGFERFLQHVASAPVAARDTIDWIMADVQAFRSGADQHDDMTMVVIRVTGPV
jgi:serine phosphatase RsbU (regulator of sigma subunit)